jgi:hypothetical protein
MKEMRNELFGDLENVEEALERNKKMALENDFQLKIPEEDKTFTRDSIENLTSYKEKYYNLLKAYKDLIEEIE